MLRELTEPYGKTTDQEIKLGIKLSHQDLANIIGGTRETTTVILGELQFKKLVALARRRVIVIDVQRLAAGINPERYTKYCNYSFYGPSFVIRGTR